MTTILAILAGYVFFSHSIWWALVLVGLLGVAQSSTKSLMNRQLRAALAQGLQWEMALAMISDRLTAVNMFLSFAIWGLAIYAGTLYFGNS